jgi:hypothetical protein
MRRYLFGSFAILGLLGVCVSAETACSSSSSGGTADAGVIPATGGSGAFGIVTVNGLQKMYLPLNSADPTSGNGVIAVVNVGVTGAGTAGAPALITNIDLGVPSFATATGGDSNVVIAASTSSNTIWFINPQNDTLTKTITLDPSYGTSSFSGGGGYVTGIAIDAANNRAILSVWNGFAIVDLGTQTVTANIVAPPSENFGFDSTNQKIYAPFYDCASTTPGTSGASTAFCATPVGPDGTTNMTEGLSVIDLKDNTVYTYEDPSATDPSSGEPIPNAPLGGEPDSAAADPTTQQVVVSSESGDYENILDFSKAVFDKTKKTVTAPHIFSQNAQAQDLEGVAIEYNKHLAFWEAEHAAYVAVANLSSIPTMANTESDGGDPVAVELTPAAEMPDLPSAGGSWSNLGDPHGIAVTTGLADGHAVGFVVDSQLQWVARIDLEGLNGVSSPDAGLIGTSAVGYIPQAQVAPFVTFLDATKKP